MNRMKLMPQYFPKPFDLREYYLDLSDKKEGMRRPPFIKEADLGWLIKLFLQNPNAILNVPEN